jgi:hypothetical protein
MAIHFTQKASAALEMEMEMARLRRLQTRTYRNANPKSRESAGPYFERMNVLGISSFPSEYRI